MPASSVPVQAVLPPKSQGDIGLDGNPFGTSCPGWGQETLAWLSSAIQRPRKAEAVGCRWPGQEGPCRVQLWCVKGKLKLILCKLKDRERKASSEWRGAMESSTYLQLLFLMEGWEESWGHCPKGGLRPCPALPCPSALSTQSEVWRGVSVPSPPPSSFNCCVI